MPVHHSQEEVAEEIAKLRAIRDHVRSTSVFGNDNQAAVDAAIQTLEQALREDAIYRRWDDDEYALDSALAAYQWKAGWEPLSPSDAWAELTPAGTVAAYYPTTVEQETHP